MGDKSHTWNDYLYRIWPGGLTFFIDGYAEVRPDALALIAEAMVQRPAALAASGVPTSGRSAVAIRKLMLEQAGIHGNLYALCASAITGLRDCGFRLPLGLYRTDPLVGAILKFSLDPSKFGWDPSRLVVQPDATWDVHGTPWWKWRNLMAVWKRTLRQAQGELENRAAREHLAVRKRGPGEIPATAQEFVGNWVAEQPQDARMLFLRRPLTYYAANKLKAPRDWSLAGQAPCLLGTMPAAIADPRDALSA
jgi:hypothetical protein